MLDTHDFTVISSLALLPATVVLLLHHSVGGWIYLACLLITLVYHGTNEKRFVALDHALAFAAIGANTYMALFAHKRGFAIAGSVVVGAAIILWLEARLSPSQYNRLHGYWHIACGLANLTFALGYTL